MEKDNIINYVRRWALETPYKIAYTFFRYVNGKRDEIHITCRQLYEEVVYYAKYLKAIGIKKGERIIIFADQRPETLYAIYGAMMIKAIFIVVPSPKDINKEQRFLTTLESSKAKYIIYGGEELDILKDRNVHIINTDEIEKIEEDVVFEELEMDDVVCLQYTSGSVNAPKGIMCTHKNIMASVQTMQSSLNQEMTDINVSWLPFFHAMGLFFGIFHAAYINRRDIIMSLEVFQEKPVRWLKAISNYKATYVVAPNSALMTCIHMVSEEDKKHLDFSSIKYILNCSEIIQKSNWDALLEAFGENGITEKIMYPGYGLSEATGLVTIGDGTVRCFEADWEALKQNKAIAVDTPDSSTRIMAGVGQCMKGIKIIIINIETKEECKEHEIGEIWIQADNVAKGYWDNEEATKETFEATIHGHEGKFLRTGDLGVFVDGELYITGRLKEMMVINGRNIYAKDIELYLKQEIEELRNITMYAFTVPVRKKERVIIAVEYITDEEEMNKLVKRINIVMYQYFNVEAYDIVFLKDRSLPRTDNGKLALMKIYHAYVGKKLEYVYSSRKHEKEQPLSEFNEIQLEIKQIFEQILGVTCNSVKDSFLDMGGSSLEIFALVRQLKEKFNLHLSLKEIISDSSIEGIEKKIINK